MEFSEYLTDIINLSRLKDAEIGARVGKSKGYAHGLTNRKDFGKEELDVLGAALELDDPESLFRAYVICEYGGDPRKSLLLNVATGLEMFDSDLKQIEKKCARVISGHLKSKIKVKAQK